MVHAMAQWNLKAHRLGDSRNSTPQYSNGKGYYISIAHYKHTFYDFFPGVPVARRTSTIQEGPFDTCWYFADRTDSIRVLYLLRPASLALLILLPSLGSDRGNLRLLHIISAFTLRR